MNTFRSYPWALLYGLYFYVLFQLVFLARLGHLNTSIHLGDVALYFVGVGSILITQYFATQLTARRRIMLIPFVLAVPFSFAFALGGGLFGWLAVVIAGLIPFALFVPVAYLLVKRTQ